jgi:sugar phosphate isomerase/epimerase
MIYSNKKSIVRNSVLGLFFLFLCMGSQNINAQKPTEKNSHSKLKTSLNAFSLNIPLLKDGSMDLDGMLEYCAEKKFDAVDITAYYFPGYPEVPSDEYLYHIKKKSFLLGVEISGTGIRNDFSNPDAAVRKEGVQVAKNWIVAAEKLGAPVIRIFAGGSDHKGYTRDQVTEWMVKDVKECVEFGKQHGVIVAIQNHHDFIVNADHAIEIIEKVNSDWFGLILDTGSYWEGDSYKQIEQTVPYAVNWQIKDQIYMDGISEKIDLDRLFRIIKKSGYSGYIPIEVLGDGDPFPKIDKLLGEVEEALKRVYTEN